MQWQSYLRRVSYMLIICIIIYLIFFRRRSPRVFLTAADVDKFQMQNNVNKTFHQRIPRIIHQTWKDEHVPERWNRSVESIRQLNADQFEYRLWTDADIHTFVRQEEPYLYQHTFVKYSHDIQRVDAFRYIVLHRLGGLYIDMDNGCYQSFESLLRILEAVDSDSPHLAAFPRTSPIGISNGFMISTKGHPLFKNLISRLPLFNHNYLIDYLTVMMSAGPLYLSINEFYFHQFSKQAVVRIVDEIVYSSIYTWHTPGNSWHGRDAQVVLYIYHWFRKHPWAIYFSPILPIIFIVVFVLCRRRLRYRRKIS